MSYFDNQSPHWEYNTSLEALGRAEIQTVNNSFFDFGPNTEELLFDSPSVRAVLIIAYVLVFGFCFFGNLAVVLVVTLHWRMRSVTKFFLGNLAFANLCVAAFCVFQNLSTHLMDSWPFGVFLCKMYHFTNSLSYTASILILVAISVERYLVLLHPFRYRRILTIQRLRIMILGVWGFSALLCSPKLYYNDIIAIPVHRHSEHPAQPDLICTPMLKSYDYKTEDMINFVVLFVLPITIMTILYTKIAMHLQACEKLVDSMNYQRRRFSSCAARPSAERRLKNYDSRNSSSKGRASSSTSSSKTYSKNSYHSERCLSTTSTSGFSFHGCSCCGDDIQCATTPCNANVIRTDGKRPPQIDKWKFRVRFRKSGGDGGGDELAENNIYFEKQNIVTYSKKVGLKGSNFGEDSIVSIEKISSIPDCVETFHVNLNDNSVGNNRNSSDITSQSEVGSSSQEISAITEWRGLRVKKNLSQNRNRQAAVRMLIVIVVTFAICNLPYHIRKLSLLYVKNFNYQSNLNLIMSPVTYLLMYVNCAINPIMYAFMSKSFRSSFEEMIKCRCRREASNDSGPAFFA